MKKIATLAVTAAIATASAPSFAVAYSTDFARLAGGFSISDFSTSADRTVADGDHKFKVTLSNLDGAVSIQVPPSGFYQVVAKAGSSFGVDYTPAHAGFDLGASYPTNTKLGEGTLSVTNTSTKLAEFNFNGVNTTTLKLDGVSQVIPSTGYQGNVTVNGFGATTFFGTLFGLGSFLGGPVSGTVDIAYKLFQDSMEILVDETNLVGGSFETVLAKLDTLPAGNPFGLPASNADGIIDGTFLANGTIMAVPEPASMALVGLGLAGLAAVRRRKAA